MVSVMGEGQEGVEGVEGADMARGGSGGRCKPSPHTNVAPPPPLHWDGVSAAHPFSPSVPLSQALAVLRLRTMTCSWRRCASRRR